MLLSDRFGPIPLTVTLDGSGNGTVSFQSNGKNARITNLFVKVSTTTNQARCNIYRGQVSDSNIVNVTNSGSTGASLSGNIDITDGETIYVVWTGGDAGSTATATFSGITIPFGEVGPTSTQWADPIAAGDGSLIFPAIKSSNYSAGSTGWVIKRDGTAEFNNVTARGELLVSGSGNAYIRIYNTFSFGPEIDLYPGDYTAPYTFLFPGMINSTKSTNGTVHQGTIGIYAPGYNQSDRLLLSGTSYEGGDSVCNMAFTRVQKDGVDMGGGLLLCSRRGSSSGAVGPTEAVAWTLPSATFAANTCYEIRAEIGVLSTTAGISTNVKIRKTNTAGVLLRQYFGTTLTLANTVYGISGTGTFITGSSPVTATLVVTLTSNTGTASIFGASGGGNDGSSSEINIYEVGDAAAKLIQDPNVPVLT